MTPSLVIGVDLGGTKIEAVLARRGSGGELEVLERTRVSTGSDDGYEAVLGRAEGLNALRSGGEERCYCGNTGCLELYASGPAVEREYQRRSGQRLALPEIALARGEDVDAEAAIHGLVEAFARGLANVIDILDPAAVVLGGGVSNLNVLYDEGARRVGCACANW